MATRTLRRMNKTSAKMAEAMDPDGHVPSRLGASAPANEMILSGYKADDRTSGVPEERRYALESPADATRSRRMRDREVSDKACVEPTVGPSCNLSPTQGAWARPTHPATNQTCDGLFWSPAEEIDMQVSSRESTTLFDRHYELHVDKAGPVTPARTAADPFLTTTSPATDLLDRPGE